MSGVGEFPLSCSGFFLTSVRNLLLTPLVSLVTQLLWSGALLYMCFRDRTGVSGLLTFRTCITVYKVRVQLSYL